MNDEQDSWFKDAFGLDLGQAANSLVSDAANAVGQAASSAVQAAVGAVTGVVGAVTGAAAAAAGAAAGLVGGGGGGGAGAASGGGTGSFPLGGSVGRGGKNAANDVRAVQRALGIADDGQCGAQTIGAIEAFQRNQGLPKADGRVDPGGATERALSGGGGGGASVRNALGDDSGGAGDVVDAALGALGEVVDGAAKLLGGGDSGDQQEPLDGGDSHAKDVADRVVKILESDGDIRAQIPNLRNMPMRELLDVMDRVNRAGRLRQLDGTVPKQEDRIKVAMRTVLQVFDALWQQLVRGLNDADRQAILERTPKDIRIAGGFEEDPKGGGGKEDGGGGGAVDAKGLTVKGKLSFKPTAFGQVEPVEVTVKLGKDGLLKSVELDLFNVKQKLEAARRLDPLVEMEASLGLNTEVELKSEEQRVVFDGVHLKLKGEVEIKFKGIPALRKIKFKLGASFGSDGFKAEFVVEFPIPGT
jgi:peptidoglycan hydrolase-like protein with peptidoglycan-binding domain